VLPSVVSYRRYQSAGNLGPNARNRLQTH